MEAAEGGGRLADIRRTKAYKQLRESLLAHLADRRLERLPYTDMVEQYMGFWVDVQQAQAEIDRDGLTILDERRGTPIQNPACATKRQASQEMRKLFDTLGFAAEAKRASAAGDDDDEL